MVCLHLLAGIIVLRSSSLLIVLQRKVVERVEVPFRMDFQMDQRTLDKYLLTTISNNTCKLKQRSGRLRE